MHPGRPPLTQLAADAPIKFRPDVAWVNFVSVSQYVVLRMPHTTMTLVVITGKVRTRVLSKLLPFLVSYYRRKHLVNQLLLRAYVQWCGWDLRTLAFPTAITLLTKKLATAATC